MICANKEEFDGIRTKKYYISLPTARYIRISLQLSTREPNRFQRGEFLFVYNYFFF